MFILITRKYEELESSTLIVFDMYYVDLNVCRQLEAIKETLQFYNLDFLRFVSVEKALIIVQYLDINKARFIHHV